MAGLKDLLGAKLAGKDGEVETEKLGGEGKVIGLYFSAHWCPPCRGFTPQLVEFYKNFKDSNPNGSKLEIVFLSSDRDQESFDDYFKEMPWHAVPYTERDVKAKLSKKFGVKGIPTLVFVNGCSGDLITKDGRSIVGDDPKGERFPWTPKTLGELLTGKLKGKDGDCEAESALAGKVRGLYFSAHWCPPCKAFTPKLVECYNKLKADGKNFEMIFASWDRSEDEFNSYFGEMPWLAFPQDDPRIKELGSYFEVEGIPTLVILDENNQVITTKGRAAVGCDPEGKEFPWHPQPLQQLTDGTAGDINEEACLIYFTDTTKEEEEQKAKEMMQSLAENYCAEQKANCGQEKLVFFYTGSKTEDIEDSLVDFLHLPDQRPLLCLVNIPGQEKYVHSGDCITKDVIEDVVNKFKTKTLEFKGLRG